MTRTRTLATIAHLTAAVAIAIAAFPAMAAPPTIVVTETADGAVIIGDGVCTLREAVRRALGLASDTVDCAAPKGKRARKLSTSCTKRVTATGEGIADPLQHSARGSLRIG